MHLKLVHTPPESPADFSLTAKTKRHVRRLHNDDTSLDYARQVGIDVGQVLFREMQPPSVDRVIGWAHQLTPLFGGGEEIVEAYMLAVTVAALAEREVLLAQ